MTTPNNTPKPDDLRTRVERATVIAEYYTDEEHQELAQILSDLLDLLKDPEGMAKEALEVINRLDRERTNSSHLIATNERFQTIRAAILSLSAENERLKKQRLLVVVSHPHNADTWDYRLNPSALDENGAVIECGEYKIRITKLEQSNDE